MEPFHGYVLFRICFALEPTDYNQTVPDALVNSLVISGNETTVAARFTELLAAGLDELNVTLLHITDASDEQSRLMHLIGRL